MAVAKVTAVAVLAILILGGAVGLYYYTSVPSPSTSTSAIASSSASQAGTNSSAAGPTGGWQVNGQPEGAWADYLGYIPAGYVLAPHYANAPTYPCPSGMDPAQCKLFQASCGNGVCDPNESCATCPFDCAPPGADSCDPYTGRAAAPVAICQLAIVNGNGQGG